MHSPYSAFSSSSALYSGQSSRFGVAQGDTGAHWQYEVRPGDTLAKIAGKFGVTVEAIVQANPDIVNPELIYVGDTLSIPGQTRYTVEWGDTLSRVAAEFGLTVNDIVRANNLASPDRIQIGQELVLPATTDITRTRHAVPAPDAHGPDHASKFDTFADIIHQYGNEAAAVDLASGKKVVVSVRHDTSVHVNDGKGEYDDRIVVIWQDESGAKHVREFAGNTDPSGRYEDGGRYQVKEIEGVDVNNDGRNDLGRLAEGTYRFEKGRVLDRFTGYRATHDQVVERDSNHDGWFNSLDTQASGQTNAGMHIHPGGNTITGSAGCLTMKPDVFNEFMELMGEQPGLNNVLVGSDRLAA